MKILDGENNEITEPDLTIGKLTIEEVVTAHHEAVQAVEEVGHYETVAEYENGGKDVAWVIDVPGAEAADAWDETETVQRYTLYTQNELDAIEVMQLKGKLAETDYIAAKIAEGIATREEYAEQIAQRQAWRERINALEA